MTTSTISTRLLTILYFLAHLAAARRIQHGDVLRPRAAGDAKAKETDAANVAQGDSDAMDSLQRVQQVTALFEEAATATQQEQKAADEEELSFQSDEEDISLKAYEVNISYGGGPIVKEGFPDIYKKGNPPVKYLGHGSFGESWLVRDADRRSRTYGQLRVMKFLYLEERGRARYITWKMARSNRVYKEKVLDAAHECDVGKAIAKAGRGSSHPGAGRVMECYGHNIPATSTRSYAGDTQPLYLLLQDCGDSDLEKYITKSVSEGTWNLELARGMLKQILEALDFLASLNPPWIHHDLKPGNLVVRTTSSEPLVYLIDFGTTVKGTRENECEFTPCTVVFAPVEYAQPCRTAGGIVGGHFGGGFMMGGQQQMTNFAYSQCGSGRRAEDCATSFDIYSFATTFVQMLSGYLPVEWSGCLAPPMFPVHHQIENVCKDLGRQLSYNARSGYDTIKREVRKALKDQAMYDAVHSVANMMAQSPWRRPTAGTALKLSWFREKSVPTASFVPFVPTTTTTTTLSSKGLPIGSWRVGDAALVWSTSTREWLLGEVESVDAKSSSVRVKFLQDRDDLMRITQDQMHFLRKPKQCQVYSYTMKGWQHALISKHLTNGQVIVRYPLPGLGRGKEAPYHYEKAISQGHDDFRYYEDTDEEERGATMSEYFHPASERPADRARVHLPKDEVFCPQDMDCDQCVMITASDGGRSLLHGRPASACYCAHPKVPKYNKLCDESTRVTLKIGHTIWNKIDCEDPAYDAACKK